MFPLVLFLLFISSIDAINPFVSNNVGEKHFHVFKELIYNLSRIERLFKVVEQKKGQDTFTRTPFPGGSNGYLVIKSYSGHDCAEPSVMTQYIAINQCERDWDFAEDTEHWYSFLFASLHLSLLEEVKPFHLSLFPIKGNQQRFLHLHKQTMAIIIQNNVLVETFRYLNDKTCNDTSNRTHIVAVAPFDQCYERAIISFASSIDTAQMRNTLSMRLYRSSDACQDGLKYHEEGIIQAVHIPVGRCIRTGKNDIMITHCDPYEDKSFTLQSCQGLSLKAVQVEKDSCSNPGETLYSFGFSGYFDFVCL